MHDGRFTITTSRSPTSPFRPRCNSVCSSERILSSQITVITCRYGESLRRYPRAALFGLCIGFVAWNALAVIKAAMRAAHGAQTVETQLSGYYFVDELESTRRGLEIALPQRAWDAFRQMEAAEFAALLVGLAKNMFLARYKKHPRGPKRPQPPRVRLGRGPGSHVSTARLLAAAKLAAKQAKCSP